MVCHARVSLGIGVVAFRLPVEHTSMIAIWRVRRVDFLGVWACGHWVWASGRAQELFDAWTFGGFVGMQLATSCMADVVSDSGQASMDALWHVLT